MLRNVLCLLLLFSLIGVFAPSGFAADETVQAKKALTTKTVELADGRVVRLAAIQAPNMARHGSEKNEAFAPEVMTFLEKFTEGKELKMRPIASNADRKGRIVAEVWVKEASVQEAMLRAGMGWVYTFPDTRRLAKAYLRAEDEAEAAKRGVWALPEYAVLSADAAAGHTGEFRLVRGVPKTISVRDKGRSYINFSDDWDSDFTLVIPAADLKRFNKAWLQSLAGKEIRVRGWLFESGGPAMELTHPEQIEVR